MFFRLCYVSTVSLDAAARLPSTVEDVLMVSCRNNRRDGITGFLVCDGFHFAQILEGTQADVERCFVRICADPRNEAPIVREIAWGRERLFPRWSMCGLYLSGLDDAVLTPPDIGFELSALSPGALWQHLESLALRYGERLDREHERLVRLLA